MLYNKYFCVNFTKDVDQNLSEKELHEMRVDEKSSLESIYGDAISEKVKNSVWVVNLKLNYLVSRFHKKDHLVKTNNTNFKKKEKCRNFIRGNCKFGSKCRFSHEEEKIDKNINAHIEDFYFELEIRFPKNTKYPYEPPLIFLKTNAVIPPLVNLHICKRLHQEAELLALDGIPSIYSIIELVQNEQEITAHLEIEPKFLNMHDSLFSKEPVQQMKRPSHYKKGMTGKDNQKILSTEEIVEIDQQLANNFIEKTSNASYIKMLQSRSRLPAWNLMSDVLRTIRNKQVVVISGETGCGKSTQVPQYILDDWLANYKNYDKKHLEIICTQPRRISALGVAERVAQERIEKIGHTVGYQIRLENKISRYTRLTFCTTGILLRRLEAEPTLQNVTHIIVDEVHERSVER